MYLHSARAINKKREGRKDQALQPAHEFKRTVQGATDDHAFKDGPSAPGLPEFRSQVEAVETLFIEETNAGGQGTL